MREKNKVLKSIVILVVTAHLLVIYLFHFQPFHTKPKKVLAKRVLRENFRMIEKPQIATRAKTATSSAKPASPKTTPVAKKTTPQPPKNTPKPTEIKKEIQVAKVTSLTNNKSEQKPIDKSLAKDLLDQWPQEIVQTTTSPTIEIPKALATLEIENMETNLSDFSGSTSSYSDKPYADYLQELIRITFQIQKMNKNGVVCLEFTLNNKGKLLNIDVKSFSDLLSKEIAIETIKKLKYAEFFGELANQQERTFVYTLKAT